MYECVKANKCSIYLSIYIAESSDECGKLEHRHRDAEFIQVLEAQHIQSIPCMRFQYSMQILIYSYFPETNVSL